MPPTEKELQKIIDQRSSSSMPSAEFKQFEAAIAQHVIIQAIDLPFDKIVRLVLKFVSALILVLLSMFGVGFVFFVGIAAIFKF